MAYIKTFKNHVVCQWKNKESAIFWFAKQELKKLKYDLFLNERNIVVPSSDNISKIICRFRKENSSTFEIIYQSILLHQNLVSLVQLLSSRIVFKKFTPYFGFHVISLPVIQVTSFQAMEEFPLIILEEFQKEYLFTGYCSSWTPLNSFQLYKLDSTDHSNDIVKESLQIWKGKIESICKSAYSRISKIEKKMAHSGFLECLR